MTTPALPTDAELAAGQPIKSDHVKALRDRKSNLDSPAFTGTPTAPTAAAGTNTTQVATTAFAAAAAALLIPLTQKGAANGVATLDAATLLPVGQLPTVAARTNVAQTFSGGTQSIALPGGGTAVNVTNQSDADFLIRLSAAGAADRVATVGPSSGNRVAFLVGNIERVQINPGAGGVAMILNLVAAQTGDAFQVRSSANALLASISASGGATFMSGIAYAPVTQTTAPAAGAAAALPATPTGYAQLTINGIVRVIAFY